MIYFLYGKDSFSIKQELKKLVSRYESKSFEVENIVGSELLAAGQFLSSIKSQGLFSQNKLVVVKDLQVKNKDSEVKSEIAKSLSNIPEGVSLIFVEEGVPDKRGKLYKTLFKLAKIKEFLELNPAQVEEFIRAQVESKKFDISNTATRDLSMLIGSDLYLLEREIEKLILYAKSQKSNQIEEDHIEEMVESITNPQIFPFIEAIANKDIGKSLVLLQEFINSDESIHYLLSMIIYQFRTLLIVKDLAQKGKRANEITRLAKLHPFVVKKSLQIVQNYSKTNLIKKYFLLHSTDYLLKTGEIDSKIAIDLLVAKIAS